MTSSIGYVLPNLAHVSNLPEEIETWLLFKDPINLDIPFPRDGDSKQFRTKAMIKIYILNFKILLSIPGRKVSEIYREYKKESSGLRTSPKLKAV